MENSNEESIIKRFKLRNVLIPVFIGLGFTAFLLFQDLNTTFFEEVPDGSGDYIWKDANQNGLVDFNIEAEFIPAKGGNYVLLTATKVFRQINWTWYSFLWLLFALATLVIKALAYMIRVRILTHNQLSWKQAFQIIMLWEFSSAVTPSVVGGAGFAVYFFNREGLSVGRSTATVLTMALLDELFYVILAPLFIIVLGFSNLFPSDASTFSDYSVKTVFWLSYGFFVVLCLIILGSVFHKPSISVRVLNVVFRLPFLTRWRNKVDEVGKGIETTSKELKKESLTFWLKAFGATYFTWLARFWILNCVLQAFVGNIDHFLVFGRQLTMWVIMLMGITPGSSGIAEGVFKLFFSDMIHPPVLVIIIAIVWRLFSYYSYLLIGLFVLPKWLKRTRRKS